MLNSLLSLVVCLSAAAVGAVPVAQAAAPAAAPVVASAAVPTFSIKDVGMRLKIVAGGNGELKFYSWPKGTWPYNITRVHTPPPKTDEELFTQKPNIWPESYNSVTVVEPWVGGIVTVTHSSRQSETEETKSRVVARFDNPLLVLKRGHAAWDKHGCFFGKYGDEEVRLNTTIPLLMDGLFGGWWTDALTFVPVGAATPLGVHDHRLGANRVAPLHIPWHSMKPTTTVGKQMHEAQSKCTPIYSCPEKFPDYHKDGERPLGKCGGQQIVNLSNNGMGSDLHGLTASMCHALVTNTALKIASPWIWEEDQLCDYTSQVQEQSLFTLTGSGGVAVHLKRKEHSYMNFARGREGAAASCYFGTDWQPCPDVASLWQPNMFPANRLDDCPLYSYKNEALRVEYRAAALEVIFTHLNPKIIHMAQRLAYETFGPEGAPRDMITIHIRWGDKCGPTYCEMELVEIETYVNGVHELIEKHSLGNSPTIYLATDSISAIDAFHHVAPDSWRIVHDPTMCSSMYRNRVELHKKKGESSDSFEAAGVAKAIGGTSGLAQLVGLLLAMEAKFFLLTLGSNWSRLINELRMHVLDQHCSLAKPCSFMTNLDSGEGLGYNG